MAVKFELCCSECVSHSVALACSCTNFPPFTSHIPSFVEKRSTHLTVKMAIKTKHTLTITNRCFMAASLVEIYKALINIFGSC